jgi:hypothetical protein
MKCNEAFLQVSNIHMPPLIIFSLFVGNVKYNYFTLTLESMRYNPQVHFVFLHILDDFNDPSYLHFLSIISTRAVPNFIHVPMSSINWTTRLDEKLGIKVPFKVNAIWGRKANDYKGALAYLYPELVEPNQRNNFTEYEFWGYGDVDLIYGNFSSFSHLFNGQYYFIRTPYIFI